MKVRRDRAARNGRFGALLAFSALIAGTPLQAAQTPAGTTINNIAHVSYLLGGEANALASNNVGVRVDEVIEFSVKAAPACVSPSSANGDVVAIGFLLTNLGNGRETFIPGTPEVIDDEHFVPEAVVEDSNGNGCYDRGTDRVIPSGGSTRELAPDESEVIFVVGSHWSGTGKIRILVKSGTGTGVTGTSVDGAGDGGGAAVMGRTGGSVDSDPGTPPSELQATLVKSQSFLAPDGSDRPLHGATITYSIVASFSGGGTASDVVIADPIPEGTAYIAGSLTIDGAPLSDAADGDQGALNESGISVALGDVPAPASRTISFKVKIK